MSLVLPAKPACYHRSPWAKAKILDIGLDVAFLNNRLSGSVDFFRRIKTGIPAFRDDVLLPEEVGFERPKENLNSNVHTGYKLLARWSDKVNDFHYSISANFTYSRFYNWEQYNLSSVIHGMNIVILHGTVSGMSTGHTRQMASSKVGKRLRRGRLTMTRKEIRHYARVISSTSTKMGMA